MEWINNQISIFKKKQNNNDCQVDKTCLKKPYDGPKRDL